MMKKTVLILFLGLFAVVVLTPPDAVANPRRYNDHYSKRGAKQNRHDRGTHRGQGVPPGAHYGHRV